MDTDVGIPIPQKPTAAPAAPAASASSSSSTSAAAPLDSKQETKSTIPASLLPAGGARKGAKQWNEDSFFHWISQTGKVLVGGIFDGHGGYNGLLASNTARETSLSILDKVKLECESWDEKEWQKRLQSLFETLHTSIREKFLYDQPGGAKNPSRSVDEKGIVRSTSGDPVHGGTTGSVVVLIRHPDNSSTIVTANVGDSTCLIIPTKGKVDHLTVDHGPENPEEYMRVKNLDNTAHPYKLLYVYDKTNVFRKYECPLVFLENGQRDPVFVQNPWGNGLHPTNVRYEPAVYAVTPRQINKDSTCIAMTRALGDFYAHQFGLTWEPSITIKKQPPPQVPGGSDFSIVLASDGVWDCWKFEDFGDYVNSLVAKDKSMSDIVELALNESIQRAIANFGAKHYDDASLVLLVAGKK